MTESKRQAIFAKYNGHCAYCGRLLRVKSMTVDHLVPKSKGGGNSIGNLMPSCRECNMAKAADNLEMLRINLVWSSLHPSDLTTFGRVRSVANKFKFFYELDRPP